MNFNKQNYNNDLLVHLYKELLMPRMIEEKMLILLRQGEISKWFSGIGQEAISVGAVAALSKEEYILPMHRNLGIFTGRGIPLGKLFSQFQGKISGYTKGRDRSFHFGSNEHFIVGMISHLGPQLGLADGIALAHKLKAEGKVTLVFTGDGGASEGDFHEALNVAAVWDLPVLFVVENNGYGLSTPSHEQFKFKNFCEKGPAYGMETFQVDGNNVLDVYHNIKNIAESVRAKPRPVLIEAMTFRMRGHEEASGTKYVPKHLFEEWAAKDPIENFENFLIKQRILSEEDATEIRKEIKAEIETGWSQAMADGWPVADEIIETQEVYAPFVQKVFIPQSDTKKNRRYVDAISDAIRQSMDKYQNLILMGQDVAEYGGVFKVTEGMADQFGKARIRNTPLCESAILGVGLGLTIGGYKSIIEMQFADFVTSGFNQIVNNIAKIHYRWGQNADVVVRMPTGAGVGAGPFHSQSNEAWFFHTPGLKIVFPSCPYDAKGLLNAAIEDPNPYMFFEHKALYRSVSEEIPEEYYTLEVGKASLISEGNRISLITYGMGVIWAKEIIIGIQAGMVDLIDLRSLLPWDKEAVRKSVEKTGKVIVFSEDCLTGSIVSEIAAWIGENCFQYLDAPVTRVGSLDTPVPFSNVLEKNYLPKERLKNKIQELLLF